MKVIFIGKNNSLSYLYILEFMQILNANNELNNDSNIGNKTTKYLQTKLSM